jgi:hypothetical protein
MAFLHQSLNADYLNLFYTNSEKILNLYFARKVANGLRYLRVGGRGFCLGAGRTRSEENAAESHTSGTPNQDGRHHFSQKYTIVS